MMEFALFRLPDGRAWLGEGPFTALAAAPAGGGAFYVNDFDLIDPQPWKVPAKLHSITPESHTIDDLGIDSLDFLDIVFAIDKAFGIKIPLEQWTQEVNDGKVPTEEYFVLKNLCAKIDELVAAKKA